MHRLACLGLALNEGNSNTIIQLKKSTVCSLHFTPGLWSACYPLSLHFTRGLDCSLQTADGW